MSILFIDDEHQRFNLLFENRLAKQGIQAGVVYEGNPTKIQKHDLGTIDFIVCDFGFGPEFKQTGADVYFFVSKQERYTNGKVGFVFFSGEDSKIIYDELARTVGRQVDREKVKVFKKLDIDGVVREIRAFHQSQTAEQPSTHVDLGNPDLETVVERIRSLGADTARETSLCLLHLFRSHHMGLQLLVQNPTKKLAQELFKKFDELVVTLRDQLLG